MMNMILKTLYAIKRGIFELVSPSNCTIAPDKAIFSFTFDDVPMSAYKNGASKLENVGAKGTFYVALGMNDNKQPGQEDKYFNAEVIKKLHQKGHDIGCHTYSHINFRNTSSQEITVDCRKNTEQLKMMTSQPEIAHFSYPFGKASLQGKRVLNGVYKTMRTIEYGINTGKTDLNYLKSISLTSASLDRDAINKIIVESLKQKAWTIFFTHDVKAEPSEWGISIDDFNWLVDKCAAAEADILSVEEAYRVITNDAAHLVRQRG